MTTDISTEATEALNDLRDELAKALEEIPGLRVTTDPRQVNPPCCLIGLPTVERIANLGVGRWTVDVTIPVVLIAKPPGDQPAISWLLRFILPVMRKLNAVEAEPVSSLDFGSNPLPTYPLAVRRRLKIQEDGS